MGDAFPTGIRQRGSGFQWSVMHKGMRATGSTKTLEEAVAARNLAINKMQEGVTGPVVWTLAQAVNATLALRWQGTKSEDGHMLNARLLLDFFGADTPVTEITASRVDDYVMSLLDGGRTNATVNRKLSTLRVVLTTALKRGHLTKLPTFDRRKEYQGRLRFLSEEEENSLLTVLGKTSHKEAVIVLMDTGMRTGELFKFQRRDVAFSNEEAVTVTLWDTKAGTSRTIPLTDRASKVITKRCFGLADDDRVFPEAQSWLRCAWDRAKERMGLADDEQFVPHILRHTCASRLVQRGVSLKVIQAFLGHENIQTTMRYAHLAPTSLNAAVEALNIR